MNLLMCSPLRDSWGTIRYFIGAQVDVSGLVKECTELESLQRLLAEAEKRLEGKESQEDSNEEKKDEFQELSEMMNIGELATVRKHGGRMHREAQDDLDGDSISGQSHKPRLLLKEHSPDMAKSGSRAAELMVNGKLSGVYQHVRVPPKLSKSLRLTLVVSSGPTVSVAANSLRITLATSTWNSSIPVHEQNWRLRSCSSGIYRRLG
jgi:hypothetical protein